jgi:hypothetical protein
VKKLFGYARTDIRCVRDAGLKFIRDDTPVERHGELVGWPKIKEQQMSIAQELAEQSKLHLY